MPVYDFECSSCSTRFERYLPLRDNQNPTCPCGGKTERVWGLGSQHIGSSAFPYITKQLTGKPIEVKSESHLRQLCKEHGVTHRPDNAFLEKTYEGYDHKAGRQKYREGSGRGLPGSWI